MRTFTDGLKFENETPLADEFGVLEILVRESRWNHYCSSTIRTDDQAKPYIEVTSASDGCSGGYSEEKEYYLLAPQVVQQLQQDRYISGVPHRGYTSKRDFRITESGEEFYWSEKRRQREEEELKKQRENSSAAREV